MNLWNIAKLDLEEALNIAENFDIEPFLAKLLQVRGLTEYDDIQSAIGDTEFQEMPFDIIDVDIAVDRIHEAVDKFERIAVYGDYDADGVTATSILYSYLKNVGANVMYYIPKREGEGYGMHKNAVKFLHENEVDLIITVDNGISSHEEIDYAKELGIDVIVTDHHKPKKTLPNALAVVDPHREDCPSEFKDYCGAGIVLKLVMALEWDYGDPDQAFLDYVDIAAIGTVADIVSLTGENRVIVKNGLEQIENNPKVGIKALLSKVNVTQVKSSDIGFRIGPRINAVGRMGSPDCAVKLLIEENYDDALSYAEFLCSENDRRKAVQEKILNSAIKKIENDDKLKYARVLVVANKNWHPGVIGIVASKLVEEYHKPAIVISIDENGIGSGSGRSYEGFSLFDCINASSNTLIKFGGHPLAAGLKLKSEDIDRFRKDVEKYAKENFDIMPENLLDIDFEVNLNELKVDIVDQMDILQPFGLGNEEPLFVISSLTLENIYPTSTGEHQKLIFSKNRVRHEFMYFNCKKSPYKVGSVLDIAVKFSENLYNGERKLSKQIEQMKPSNIKQKDEIYAYNIYEKFKRQEVLTEYEQKLISPVRDDMAVIYKTIQNAGRWEEDIYKFLSILPPCQKINIAKLLISLQAMQEFNLVSITQGEIFDIKLLPKGPKVNIMSANVIKALAASTEE